MPTETTNLVHAARQDHPGAQATLAQRWLPIVLGWCARLGGPQVDPEDAAHDVLVTALARLQPVAEGVVGLAIADLGARGGRSGRMIVGAPTHPEGSPCSSPPA